MSPIYLFTFIIFAHSGRPQRGRRLFTAHAFIQQKSDKGLSRKVTCMDLQLKAKKSNCARVR
jgi:hypothetical protein